MEPRAEIVEWVWPDVAERVVIEERWVPAERRRRAIGVRYARFDPATVVGRAWAALDDLAARAYRADAPGVPSASSAERLGGLEAPTFFAPWHPAIVATGVPAIALSPAGDAAAAFFGGARAVGDWPACPEHGPCAHALTLSADVACAITGEAADVSLHVCVPCLDAERSAWLGRSRAASIAIGAAVERDAASAFREVRFAASRFTALPPSWLFAPRYDVEGHAPVGGAAGEVLAVKLAGERPSVGSTYADAAEVYDRRYATLPADVVVGGFSKFRWAACPTCHAPMRQVFHVNDYFSDEELADALSGSNELTLLACDRTAACGGLARGLLAVDP